MRESYVYVILLGMCVPGCLSVENDAPYDDEPSALVEDDLPATTAGPLLGLVRSPGQAPDDATKKALDSTDSVNAAPLQVLVTNGDFFNGPASWSWKRATVSSDSPAQSCYDSMAQFTATYSNTPTSSDPQRGRYATVSNPGSVGTGRWATCRQIEQQVHVPLGTRLQFDAQLGELTNPAPWFTNDVTLEVIVEDVATGVTAKIFSKTGASSFVSHPGFTNGHTADISKFWGRDIRLKFRALSTYQNSSLGPSSVSSPAYVDNIGFANIPTSTSSRPTSGQWYNPSRSGHGLHLSKSPDGNYLLLWYTYLPTGRPVWYISDVQPVIDGVWQSALHRTIWDTATQSNTSVVVGDVKIQMLSPTRLNLYWDLYSVNGDGSGYDGAEPMAHLWGGESYTGLWYEPALSGWGVSLDHKVNADGIDTIATAFYYEGTEPVWAQGTAEGTPGSGQVHQLNSFTGYGLCPQCFGQTIAMTSWPVGNMGLSLDSNQGWINVQQQGGAQWNRGASSQPVGIYRLTYP